MSLENKLTAAELAHIVKDAKELSCCRGGHEGSLESAIIVAVEEFADHLIAGLSEIAGKDCRGITESRKD